MQMVCLFCGFDWEMECVAIVKIIIFAFQAKVLARANSSKILALTKLVRSSIYKTDASKSF
jgi:hypothetical protein